MSGLIFIHLPLILILAFSQGYSLLTANRKLLQHATWRSVADGRGDTPEQLAIARLVFDLSRVFG